MSNLFNIDFIEFLELLKKHPSLQDEIERSNNNLNDLQSELNTLYDVRWEARQMIPTQCENCVMFLDNLDIEYLLCHHAY